MPDLSKRVEVAVGIDPSATGTGLAAVALVTGELVSHTRIRTGTTGVTRLVGIRATLEHWLKGLFEGGYTVTHVAMEGYSFGSRDNQAHKLGEVGGLIKVALYDFLPEPACFPSIPVPSQIKKFCTGSGKTAKEQMVKEVYKKWGEDFTNSDEADAYTCAQIAKAIISKTGQFKYETEVIEAMRKSGSAWAEMPHELRYELGIGL